jgi:hypothetical protein
VDTQLHCSTDPYAPVVMTARDDNTVGSVVPGSTGTVVGTYANPALAIARGSQAAPGELDRLRILHATKAITINGSHYGSGPTFRNLQLVQCEVGIEAYFAGTIKVLNALFHQVDRVFSGLYYTTVDAQHLTVHQASWFNHNPVVPYSAMHLVNSLLVEVANPGYYDSAVSVGIESNGAGVFEPVGAGGHYLQVGSPHRNVGTNSIDTGLAARLERLTTYAPVVLAGPITQDTVLEPQAWRDVDRPDRGFHYEPVDYAVNALQVQNATLTLTNGVVLATYGQNGLWLNSGAVLRSVGRPTERNHIVRFNTVMEQPLHWGGGGIDNHLAINPYHASGTAPVVECRFTDFGLLGYAGYHLYTLSAGWVIGHLGLRDCGLRGGNVTLGGPAGTALELTNNLWLSTITWLFGTGSLQAYHNLFRRGYVVLEWSSGSWVMRDNVFDRCEIWDYSAVTHSHNAFSGTWPFGTPTLTWSPPGAPPHNANKTFYVPRGTDALLLRVRATTATVPAQRAGKNDTMFYRIWGDALGTTLQGSFCLHQFPSEGPDPFGVNLVPSTWVDVHERLGARDGLLHVAVVAVGHSPNGSGIEVGTGALWLQLEEVWFGDPLWDADNHFILQDDGSGQYDAPQWHDPEPLNLQVAGVAQPVCYTSGARMRLDVRWRMKGSAPILVLGDGNGSYDFPQTAGTQVLDHNRRFLQVYNLDCTTAFQTNRVDFLNPLSVQWWFQPEGYPGWIDAGLNTNQVYVTLKNPLTMNLYHTVVHLACDPPGALDDSGAVANTWINFAGPANVTTWNGIPLTYYATSTGGYHTDTGTLLSTHDGQCHSFATLFVDSLRANGIPNITITRVKPVVGNGQSAFGVKNLAFSPTPTYPAEPFYKYASTDIDTSVAGIPGQNTNPPQAKLFVQHFIVRHGTNKPYLDPSYGLTTMSAAEFSANIGAWRGASDGRWRNSAGSGLQVEFHYDNPY